MVASEKGHLDVIMTLFEAGAEVYHTNKVVNKEIESKFCIVTGAGVYELS